MPPLIHLSQYKIMPSIILLLCLLVVIFYQATSVSSKIVCYYPNWVSGRPGNAAYSSNNIDPTLCTQIIYSFAVLDAKSYTMVSYDPDFDINQGNYKKIVDMKKKNKRLKVLIAIGGWSDSRGNKYSQLVADSKRRANFIKKAMEFIKKYNFDGLDFDWEYPGSSDKANFARFIKELKAAFKPLKLLLTAAVSAVKGKIDEAYDVKSLGQNLDQIHVMAYDFKGSWEGRTGHHSPIQSSDDLSDDGAIKHLIKRGAPTKKLILGMPLYGRTWTLANARDNGLGATAVGPGKSGKYTREEGGLAYFEICSMSWDKVVSDPSGKMGPYAYKDKQWVSYDDARSLKKKVEYLKSKGLGGAMVWDISQDDFNGQFCGKGHYPLMKAINNAMGKQ